MSAVALKRPAEDDGEQDGPGGSQSKRILTEDQARPPLSRGDSLPTVPFAGERPPNFKDKHPVRAPSFDTATFKAGSEYTFLHINSFSLKASHVCVCFFSFSFPRLQYFYVYHPKRTINLSIL